MNKRNLILKIAAVASSVLLVSAFIAYRVGAFDWLVGDRHDRPAVMGGSKYKVIIEPGSLKSDPAFMSSSKSLILAPPSSPTITIPFDAINVPPTSPSSSDPMP